MVIRPALPEDNEALCRMELLAPQGTAIRLTEHRRDFAARASQLPYSTLLVAADKKTGSLIGVLGGAPVRIRVGGRERTGGLLFDLRANPEYERGMSRALYLMWQELEKRLRGVGVEFMYGLVKEDNPALSIYHRLGGKERSRRKYWTLPVYRRLPVPPEVEAARRIDAAADYSEASQWYRDYDLWPLLDEPASLQPLYDRCLWGVLSCRGASLKI
ncbi:MAG: N-acetyltransferase family protein [Patescibacteria group bacterium]